MDLAGDIDAPPRHTAHVDVGIEIRGDDVAGNGLCVPGRDRQIHRPAGLQHAERSRHPDAAGRGGGLEALDLQAALVAPHVRGDVRQIHAAPIIAQASLREGDAAAHQRRGRAAGHGGVGRQPARGAHASRLEEGVGQAYVQFAGNLHVDGTRGGQRHRAGGRQLRTAAGRQRGLDGRTIAVELRARMQGERRQARRSGVGKPNIARVDTYTARRTRRRPLQTRVRFDRAAGEQPGREQVHEIRPHPLQRGAQVEHGCRLTLDLEHRISQAQLQIVDGNSLVEGQQRGRQHLDRLTAIAERCAGELQLPGIDVQFRRGREIRGRAVQVGQLRGQPQPQRVGKAPCLKMHVAREPADDDILPIHRHLRLSVTLNGHEADGALCAAGQLNTEEAIEIAELGDVQGQLPVALCERGVRSHISFDVRAPPFGLANLHAKRFRIATVDGHIEIERRPIERAVRLHRAARRRRQAACVHGRRDLAHGRAAHRQARGDVRIRRQRGGRTAESAGHFQIPTDIARQRGEIRHVELPARLETLDEIALRGRGLARGSPLGAAAGRERRRAARDPQVVDDDAGVRETSRKLHRHARSHPGDPRGRTAAQGQIGIQPERIALLLMDQPAVEHRAAAHILAREHRERRQLRQRQLDRGAERSGGLCGRFSMAPQRKQRVRGGHVERSRRGIELQRRLDIHGILPQEFRLRAGNLQARDHRAHAELAAVRLEVGRQLRDARGTGQPQFVGLQTARRGRRSQRTMPIALERDARPRHIGPRRHRRRGQRIIQLRGPMRQIDAALHARPQAARRQRHVERFCAAHSPQRRRGR